MPSSPRATILRRSLALFLPGRGDANSSDFLSDDGNIDEGDRRRRQAYGSFLSQEACLSLSQFNTHSCPDGLSAVPEQKFDPEDTPRLVSSGFFV